MAQLHLPAGHEPTDRDMALAVARVLDSGDLYVTWTSGSGARPPASTSFAVPPRQPRRRGVLARVFGRRRVC